MSEPLTWRTEQRQVQELGALETNPRSLTLEQETQLRQSLEKFNLVEIPAIDTDNTILAGHQRVKVLALLGRGTERIDVRVPNRKLTPRERREYNLRSNKTTGGWDTALLATMDPDLLKEVGFDDVMVDKQEPEGAGGGAGVRPRTTVHEVECPECGAVFTPKRTD